MCCLVTDLACFPEDLKGKKWKEKGVFNVIKKYCSIIWTNTYGCVTAGAPAAIQHMSAKPGVQEKKPKRQDMPSNFTLTTVLWVTSGRAGITPAVILICLRDRETAQNKRSKMCMSEFRRHLELKGI